MNLSCCFIWVLCLGYRYGASFVLARYSMPTRTVKTTKPKQNQTKHDTLLYSVPKISHAAQISLSNPGKDRTYITDSFPPCSLRPFWTFDSKSSQENNCTSQTILLISEWKQWKHETQTQKTELQRQSAVPLNYWLNPIGLKEKVRKVTYFPFSIIRHSSSGSI